MGQYIQEAKGTKRVIDLHDVVSIRHRMLASATRNPVMRVVHSWEANRMADFEAACLEQFDAVWVTTTDEAAKLRAQDTHNRVRATLRGIDLSGFHYGLENPNSNTVIFTGHMSYEPNVDGALYYLREIHNLVRRSVPAVQFQVVGNYPHRSIIRAARKDESVAVTGRVPDMAEYLRKARVFVAPLRIGTGVRVKLLEAFAVGLPVVCTAVGCRGLAVRHDEHLLIADSAEDFARAVTRLFRDQALYERLSRSGRTFVEQNYGLDRAAAQLEGFLRELKETGGAAA
jgi:glycosyltransferase involved in cell wall biosynthesis